MYKLLSATPSPYARKVRIALIEKDLPFELLTEVPWNDDTSTPRYNPLEKLPVLIPEQGDPVYESSYIMEWLEVRHPTPALYPADPEERLAARRFQILADGICDAMVILFFERLRDEKCRSQPWFERQRRKIEGGARELARITPTEGFCVGGRFGIADIAVGTVLAYLALRYPEFPWRDRHPDLGTVLDRLSERPSFAATVTAAQPIAATVI